MPVFQSQVQGTLFGIRDQPSPFGDNRLGKFFFPLVVNKDIFQ